MSLPNRLEPGKRLSDNDELNFIIGNPMWQTNANITALAGGGRSAATPALTLGSNHVSVVASAADSVVLPSAVAGNVVFLANAGANALQVFAVGSDTINGTAGATGISVANAKRIMFVAIANNTWFGLLGA